MSCRGPLGPAVRIYHLASIAPFRSGLLAFFSGSLPCGGSRRGRGPSWRAAGGKPGHPYGFTARICLVEVPSISPIMAAYIFRPSPLCLAAGVVLTAMLTAAVARRWSEPPRGEFAPEIGNRRRRSWRYYHERRGLVLLLGVVSPANYRLAVCGQHVLPAMVSSWHFSVSQWVSSLCSLYFPTSFLSLVLVLLAVQVAFFRATGEPRCRRQRAPRLTPALLLTVWLLLTMIVVCSVPALSVVFRLLSHGGLSLTGSVPSYRERFRRPAQGCPRSLPWGRESRHLHVNPEGVP